MICIERYSSDKKQIWDTFVEKSRNGLFLFFRNYMDYHKDRFPDHSLIISEESKVIAILPGTVIDGIYISHPGLTFGGFIIDNSMTTSNMILVFQRVIHYLKDQKINKIIYKCIPYIYSDIPCEEDRYALFLQNSQLIRRDVTTSINLSQRLAFQKIRRRCITKAKKTGITVKESEDYATYWRILTECLIKYHETLPVHSVREIQNLKEHFPNNIRLFCSFLNDKMLAGVIIFENKNIAHAQYIASSDDGREMGALDVLFAELIEKHFVNKKYFDFGISNENEGKYLNEGLIFYKEGFGARAIVHDFYEVDLIDR